MAGGRRRRALPVAMRRRRRRCRRRRSVSMPVRIRVEQVGGWFDVGAGVVEGVGEEAFEAAGHRSSSISAVRSGTWSQ